ncbi:hypothetical protein Pcinc_028724 [Petrolisthes cinctipes]|uniref:UHRF1-binding protein 1-like n=1 Tax=Petrolisthes cinctipes TaxID=88211 RepID=A0AAE1F2F8_PETCI|nr:hypothetical protein Pcinc_028724 [Petrolisthes cinctipes]
MVGLIKNQILKHLSKFAKNVSSDSVNVSTLKGEGELTNLELNEIVLTDLLELPTWLRITRAQVNRVNLKIQWTKLKSVPILVSLDEVQVEMETCQELRSQASHTVMPSYSSGGCYGFADKVMDGMTVTVNAVLVTFRSHAFHASFQLSRIVLDSKSPLWQKADLRSTRLKDPERGELLIFKELSWQTLRIEARSTKDPALTPLRLITNQAHCRITIKKKLTDCSVVGCRLVLLMDDLLWVLTDSQLTAAFHFMDSLSDLIKQATQQSQKTKAVRKLESLPEFQAQLVQQARGGGGSSGGRGSSTTGGSSSSSRQNHPSVSKMFSKCDVLETSYHFYSERIDLHFCDDPGPGRSSHPDLSGGAALQAALLQLQVDFYPYHLAAGDRTHWVKYASDCGPAEWAQTSLAQFRTLLADTLNPSRPSHTPLSRAPPHPRHEPPTPPHQSGGGRPPSTSGEEGGAGGSSPHKGVVATQLRKLMSSCCVLRVSDYCVYRVSTSRRKQAPKEFISGDRGQLKLPTQMPSLHLEFTTYYYPAESEFPVPPPKLYLQVNPMQVTLDPLSLLWLNAFSRSMQRALAPPPSVPPPTPPYMDVHLEAVRQRLLIEAVSSSDGTCSGGSSNQRDRPHSMQVQVSRVVLSNTRPPDPTLPGSLASLAAGLEAAQQGDLFFASNFPASSQDFQPICHKFLKHAMGDDNVREPPSVDAASTVYQAIAGMKRDSLWTQARDVLFLHCEPVWVEFLGVPAARSRPVPFVDAFPLSLWIYVRPRSSQSCGISQPVGGMEAVGKSARGARSASVSSEGLSKTSATGDRTQDSAKRGGGSGQISGSSKSPEAAVHMFCHVPSLVSAQLNHYQYLFLLRQLDAVTELTTFLTHDTHTILTHPNLPGTPLNPAALDDTLVMSTVVPQVDVSLVMPPPHLGKDSVTGDGESFLPDSSSTADIQDLGSPGCEVRNSASEHSIVQRLAEAEAAAAATSTPDITKSFSVDQLTSPQRSPAPCPLPVTANGTIGQQSAAQHSPTIRSGPRQSPSAAVKSAASRQLSSSLTNLPGGTTQPHLQDPSDPNNLNGPGSVHLNLHGNLNAGFSTMRKGITSGFTNLMSTLESAVKTSPEDASDTLSVRSDLSSDSDNFVLINVEGERSDAGAASIDALFRVDHKQPPVPASVELASEVFEEPTPSEISDITSSFRRKDAISVVTIRVSRVQVIQESRGYESTVKLQCCHLVCHECTTMAYHEFQKRPGCNDGAQSKFSSRCRGWSDSMANAPDPCSLKVRLQTSLVSEKPRDGLATSGKGTDAAAAGTGGMEGARGDSIGGSGIGVGEDGKEGAVEGVTRGISGAPLPAVVLPFLKARVEDLNLAFMMSTITSLVDLIEDELPPQPLPMEIIIERVRLRLTEDRVPANITSPGVVPTQVWLPRMLVTRDTHGVFTILPQPQESPELIEAQEESRRLREEVRRLREELAASHEERRTLHVSLTKLKEEKDRPMRGFSLPKFPLP